jgi:hypothetical protein
MAEEKTWEQIIDIKNNPAAFIVSGTLFMLYLILTLIDTNDLIKSYNILDVDNTTRSTIIFSYLCGYFMFVIKLLIAILTIFVIVTIIRISIIVILNTFKNLVPSSGGGIVEGAADIKRIYKGGSDNMIMDGVESNFRFFLGYFTVPSLAYFIFLYLVIIPLVFLFFLYVISQFYDQAFVQNTNQDKASSILNTNHHFILFMMTILVSIGALYVMIKYYDLLNGADDIVI